MPPSPALRYSPGRDPRMDSHKRGRSLEAGLPYQEKDDDLALFNEMQSREKEDFLLQSTDDFEDTFSSKLRHFSDFKLGISIPVRGESSELLNADGEKNDYDWLLTPPDTPLFPSLDDDPPPVNVVSRGRQRSQPISISRSSTMEKSYRSSRGSASPNRLSPSPQSVTSTLQSRGRSSSAPYSPPHCQRPATPSPRRPSPPPGKTSSSAPRSSTPTPRRISTGSGASGTSPIRTSRGNSASPKTSAWQSNIPGFSSEVPPNLRTSLADRPASYVRGSSPASRNGRESSSKSGRQSMSPTATRSVSSSHSHERDRISSHSKGSVASSGDDDVDSLQSIHVGSLDRLISKRISALPNNRAPMLSKKSSRTSSPNSAPKRTFDSALRQMDHRKNPQKMFRPLLSSVPSTTFYVGKASSAHRPFVSRNSSVTNSSNTSSDQGTGGALDTEGSDQHQEDRMNESRNILYPDVQDEIFLFDKVDVLHKDGDNDSLPLQLGDFDVVPAIERDPGDSEEFMQPNIDTEICSADTSCVRVDSSDAATLDDTKVCSKCCCRYHDTETLEKDVNLCPDCFRQESLLAATTPGTALLAVEKLPMPSMKIFEEYEPSDEKDTRVSVPESPIQDPDMDLRLDGVEASASGLEDRVKLAQSMFHEQSHTYSEDSSLCSTIVEGDEQRTAGQQRKWQPDRNMGHQLLTRSDDFSSLQGGGSEGAGISVLLRRSSSSKGSVIHGRSFVASTITYDDLSCARNSANSFRSSVGHSSTSASSSVDFTTGRQHDTRVRRQLSCGRSDVENYRCDSIARPQSTGSSLTGSLNDAHLALGRAPSMHEEIVDVFNANMSFDAVEVTSVGSNGKVVASDNKERDISNSSVTGEAVSEEHSSVQHENIGTHSLTSVSPTHKIGIQLEENSAGTRCENPTSETEDFPTSVSNLEASGIPSEFAVEAEHILPSTSLNGSDVADSATHRCLASISEIDGENCCRSNTDSESDDMSPHTKSANGFQVSPVTAEESTVMIDCWEGSKGRSLTLEEATDTILFCSSIVHDLAYQAAAIAIEKETSVPLEGSRPTVTILGKSTPDRKDQRGRTPVKRPSKSTKVRQKRVETAPKSPYNIEIENDENADGGMVRNVGIPKEMDSSKPPKLESKCNCTIM